MLYWMPLPTVGGAGRAVLVVAVAIGVMVTTALWSRSSAGLLISRPAVVDVLPVGMAAFAIWFFAPLLAAQPGARTLASVLGGFGNDNVAHFSMVEMIRSHGASGPWWGASPDGSPFAYDVYPQHFHALVAFVIEALVGVAPADPGTEVALFCVGTAIVLGAALIVLVAAIASVPVLRVRPIHATAAALGVPATLLLGFGATALTYGFPSFLLAVIATATAVVLALGRVKEGTVEIAAAGALAVVVGHSWALIAPVAAAAFLVMLASLPRAPVHRHPWRLVPPVLVTVVTTAGAVYAAVLVWRGTSASGSPQEALETPGGVMAAPPWMSVAVVLVVTVVSAMLVIRRPRSSRIVLGAGAVPLVAGVAALVVAGTVIGVQLARVGELSYFQFKLLNGLFLVFAVLLVVLGAVWSAETFVRYATAGAEARRRRVLGSWFPFAVVTLVAAAPVVGSIADIETGTPLDKAIRSGIDFRTAFVASAHQFEPAATRVLAAAAVSGGGCAQPVLIDDTGDLASLPAAQWSMALSGTWTTGSAELTRELWGGGLQTPPERLPAAVAQALEADPGVCVVVRPEAIEPVLSAVAEDDRARILSW